MLCREEMERDHREQEQEQADAEGRVLLMQGRALMALSRAVRVRDSRPEAEAGAGLLAQAAGRVLAIKRRQEIARRS